MKLINYFGAMSLRNADFFVLIGLRIIKATIYGEAHNTQLKSMTRLNHMKKIQEKLNFF